MMIVIIAGIRAVKAGQDIIQTLVGALGCTGRKHRAGVQPLPGASRKIIFFLAEVIAVAGCSGGGCSIRSTTESVVQGRGRRATMRKVRGIAQADQLHGNILVGNAAGNGRVRCGKHPRAVCLTNRVAELTRRLRSSPVARALPMLRHHRRSIRSVSRRASPVCVFTVAIALWGGEWLICVGSMSGPGEGRPGSLMDNRLALRRNRRRRGGDGHLRGDKQRQFL